MKTVLLFPGLDALFAPGKYRQWMSIPSVAEVVDEANAVLEQLTGQKENLTALLIENRHPHVIDFDRTCVGLTGIQVGIARSLQKHASWDYVLGCSHGDLARSVICEAITLQSAIEIIWTFSTARKALAPGRTANVRTVDGEPLDPSHISWLEDNGATVSIWSAHHATAAAENTVLEKLVLTSRERNLKVKPVFPFAIHSSAMNVVASYFEVIAEARWPVQKPQWPVFSSVFVDFISEPHQIRSEAIAGAIRPIRWVDTLKTLCEKHQVTKFLNVGPSNALTSRSFDDLKIGNILVEDAFDYFNTVTA